MKRGLLSSFTEEEKKNFPVMEPLSLVTIKAQLSPVRKLSPSALVWQNLRNSRHKTQENTLENEEAQAVVQIPVSSRKKNSGIKNKNQLITHLWQKSFSISDIARHFWTDNQAF
jgi:hypothetical protein